MKTTSGSPERQDTSRTEVRVSVVIPSYNSEKTIVPCLESVLRQACDFPFEVIVVDSSQDRTPELIQSEFPQVHLIHLERRTWSGTARNIGASKAKGEFLAFLDSDCVVCPAWVNFIEEALQDGYAAVGGPILNGNPESLVSWAGYFMEFSEWFPGRPRGLVKHIPSCNIAYRREVFERSGGFPNDFSLYVDFHLNFRLSEQGEKILFFPDMWVQHSHRTTLQNFLDHQRTRGEYGAKARAIFQMSGSFVLRFPLLSPLWFFPTRLTAITLRTLRYHPSWFLQLTLACPLLALGTALWIKGFVQETRYGR
jgi:GT2 family glycosyltransferase